MDIKYGHGLEFDADDNFQEEKTSDGSPEIHVTLEQILRHGFRTPVGEQEQISLTINGNHYVVFNLSERGVGIYLNHSGEMKSLAQFQGILLTIGGHSFSTDGVVMHLSNDGIHDLCGIELISISNECQDAIIRYLQKSRSSLFVP
ncbi:MAG: PilZ domain-containing protein [Proteobacteria bacterium]|nr:PilZ domain-containing protein [Desulfobulbaceae bacterium]MBU4153391.1 PilZ domain-containing protein [Pseudomonadota bacterium]MDP2106911.1 PilZ domain-containing protein [Desulfobulbaceae bacterium]